jgi:hypothetical protein
MPGETIDAPSNTRPAADGLGQHNPSPSDEIVRRGQEALRRIGRNWEDWLAIAEALQVGRAEVMGVVHTNQPTGKRYAKAMADWLLARGFHVIDKGTRTRVLECLEHRTEIEKWRETLTEGERLQLNHPDAVLRKWKAKTVPDPDKPKKPSAMAKLKESVARLEEENHRMRTEIERGGGDLWNKDDRPEDIADIMLTKLSSAKAERVACVILAKLSPDRKARIYRPNITRRHLV